MKRVRLTMSQALVQFLDNQYIECDGVESKFVSGIFGIFGHGCVVGVGQALEQGGHNLKFYQGKNEQNMALAAVAYAKQMDRKAIIPCVSSIGPGATNMVTACGCATANRIPLLVLPGDTFACRQPDPVLQQAEFFDNYGRTVTDAFKGVCHYFDRINRPEQLMTGFGNDRRGGYSHGTTLHRFRDRPDLLRDCREADSGRDKKWEPNEMKEKEINEPNSTDMNRKGIVTAFLLAAGLLAGREAQAQRTYEEMEQLTVNERVTMVVTVSEPVRPADISTDKESLPRERKAYNNSAVSMSTAEMTRYARRIGNSPAKIRNVVVVKKATFPNDKIPTIEMTERRSCSRNISLNIDYEDVLSADSFNANSPEEE